MSIAHPSPTPAQLIVPVPGPTAIRVPTSAATLEGFRAWVTSDDFPEKTRATFLGTEILIDMSPEETDTHAALKLEIYGVLLGLVRESDEGKLYPDRVLLTNEVAGLSTEPDGTFFTRETFRSGRIRKTPRKGHPGHFIELVGTPDWVMEIVSLSSTRKDNVLLRDAYHRAGVSEYWLIDAWGEAINFRILLREEGGYADVPPVDDWTPSRIFGRAFRLDRREDELGWVYTLHVR